MDQEHPRGDDHGFGFNSGQNLAPAQRDAGSQRLRAVVTWSLAAGLLLLTFVLQRPGQPDPELVEKAVNGLNVPRVAADERLLAKLAIAGQETSSGSKSVPPIGITLQPMLDQTVGFVPPKQGIFATPPGPNTEVKIKNPEQAGAAQRFRVALLAGETYGPAAALRRLDELAPLIDPASELVADMAVMRGHFERLVEQVPSSDAKTPAETGMRSGERALGELDDATVRSLLDRHGMFAASALRDVNDEARAQWAQAVGSGDKILFVVLLLSIGFLGLMLAGLSLCVVAVIGFSQGWLRFRMREWIRPDELTAHDRLVWVETVVVFLAMFTGLKLVLGALGSMNVSQEHLGTAGLLGQWLVLPSIFWPLVRGVTWTRWKQHLGWTSKQPGEGKRGSVLREIGAGVLGHVAWLFIYVCGAMVVLLVYTVVSSQMGGEPPSGLNDNPMVEFFAGGGLMQVVMIVLLASIWAPVVEETVFRGILFRHWRPVVGFAGAAIASAVLFAALHGYQPIQLVLVGLLGLGFALIREWRGSIIGCAAAHCAHNFCVTVVMTVLIGVLA